jgi:5-aminopentanamidase
VALRSGAELIALPANWPRDPLPPDGRPILHSLAAIIAYLNKVFVAVCDRCGTSEGSSSRDPGVG